MQFSDLDAFYLVYFIQ